MKRLLMISTLLTLFNGIWMIEPGYAHAAKPVIQALLDRGNVDFSAQTEKFNALLSAYAQQGIVTPTYKGDNLTFVANTPGSIAFVPLTGPVMKNDYCGALGTKTITSLIQQATDNPNIIGTLLYVDSPGGAALGTNEAATAIYALAKQKPVVTYVDNMMCSAAMWIGSSANYIVVNKNDFAMVGSIGTYMTLQKPAEGGPQLIEIYADASTDKNLGVREALKGNTQPLLDEVINPLNDSFLAGMKRNRYGLLNKAEVLTGKTFQAKQAVQFGLADQAGTMNDAISKINQLAKKNKA
jgi:ClpP class serine protease